MDEAVGHSFQLWIRLQLVLVQHIVNETHTIRSRSSSTVLSRRPNSLSDPAMMISSSVLSVPIHSNEKLVRVEARFRCALDRTVFVKEKEEAQFVNHSCLQNVLLTVVVLTLTPGCIHQLLHLLDQPLDLLTRLTQFILVGVKILPEVGTV